MSDQPLIDWGVAARSLANHNESGDQYLVEPFPNGVLAAVIDGLGYGEKAEVAAKTAVKALKEAAEEPVTDLLQVCHKQLRQTRGVVMSLASFNGLNSTLTWLGVGNVEGILLRSNGQRALSPGDGKHTAATESLLLQGGIVGYRLLPCARARSPSMWGTCLSLRPMASVVVLSGPAGRTALQTDLSTQRFPRPRLRKIS